LLAYRPINNALCESTNDLVAGGDAAAVELVFVVGLAQAAGAHRPIHFRAAPRTTESGRVSQPPEGAPRIHRPCRHFPGGLHRLVALRRGGGRIQHDHRSSHLRSGTHDRTALRAFLRRMPKGGDLHTHLAGAVYAERFIAWAAHEAAQEELEKK